jgi:hypothetical protein
MKAGRELVNAGRASVATYEPPLLMGEVREGRKNYRAGLRVRTATDIENICTCPESRRWGTVCAHSLAVGLTYLAPATASQPDAANGRPPRVGSRFVPLHDPGATAIALRFILPPNFRAAWSKQQVMVCVEAELGSRRVMLDALSCEESFACDDLDLAAIENLANSLGSDAGGMNILSAAGFLRWLPTLRGHPRIGFGRKTPVQVCTELYQPKIVLRRAGDGFEVAAKPPAGGVFLTAGRNAWLLRGDDFLEVGSDLPLRLTNVLQEPLRLKNDRADEFFALELPLWRKAAEVESSAEISLPTVAEGQPTFTLKIDGSLQQLHATLRCVYGPLRAFSPGFECENLFVFRDITNGSRLLVRNPAAETEAVLRLERAGFSRKGEDYEMRDTRRIVRFFAFDFPVLPTAWKISVAPRLEKASSALEPLAPTIEIVRSGEDWFELKYSVASESGEEIPFQELQRLLRSGQNQARSKNGKIAVLNSDALDDFEQLLRDADPRQNQPGIYRLNKIQAGYLIHTAEEIGARLIDAAQALQHKADNVGLVEQLGPLGEQLRDYQLAGVSWLAALAARDIGGILADEMGLGKTVQTLAFLLLQRGSGPALIVCPTSLLTNWQREAERFTPTLKLLLIDGANSADKIAGLATL